MSQVLRRAAAKRAVKLQAEASPEPSPQSVREARARGVLALLEPRDPVRRPINLERRARFARIAEEDAPSDA